MSLFDQRIRSVEEPKKCKKDSPILNNSIMFIAFHYSSGLGSEDLLQQGGNSSCFGFVFFEANPVSFS